MEYLDQEAKLYLVHHAGSPMLLYKFIAKRNLQHMKVALNMTKVGKWQMC